MKWWYWLRAFFEVFIFKKKVPTKVEESEVIKEEKESTNFEKTIEEVIEENKELLENLEDSVPESIEVKEDPTKVKRKWGRLPTIVDYMDIEEDETVERLNKLETKLKKLEEQPSMYKFSESSLKKLETCHPDLQRLMKATLAVSVVDFGIAVGQRNQKEQDEAYRTGKSKLPWPKSKHNSSPSMAVDVFAYVNGKVDWDLKYYYYIYGVVTAVAAQLNIKIRHGLNFNQNSNFSDDAFLDGVHCELVE